MLPIIIAAIESPQDRDLMIEFYLTHKGRMYTEAWKYMNNAEDVEDMVYEALTRIIDKMDVFRDLQPNQRIVYSVTAVRNLCYIQLTRNSLHTMVSFDALEVERPLQDTVSMETMMERKLLNEQVRQVWSTLTAEERMLLEQKYILRWTDEELSKLLGIQPQSVRMRLTRAKRSVIKQLKSRGFDLTDWE